MKGYTAPSRIRSVIAVFVAMAVVLTLGYAVQQRREAKHEQIKTDAMNVAADVSATTGKILGAFPSVADDNRSQRKALPFPWINRGEIAVVQWGPDGIPNDWCTNHPGACDDLRAKAAANAIQLDVWKTTHPNDTVKGDHALPPRLERAVKLAMSGGAKHKACDYCDMVGPADCVLKGYPCYYPTYPRPEIDAFEKGVLACGGTAIAGGMGLTLAGKAFGVGKAGALCFSGAFEFFKGIWIGSINKSAGRYVATH